MERLVNDISDSAFLRIAFDIDIHPGDRDDRDIPSHTEAATSHRALPDRS